MGSLLTLGTLQTAIELGLIYALVALALFLSYSMLNVCDLSTDGSFVLGCAVGAVVALSGHPILAILCAMLAGVVSGFVTAQLQTRFGVPSILAGIIVTTGLYSVNIFIMGNKSILNLVKTETVFTMAKDFFESTVFADYYKLIVAFAFAATAAIFLMIFLKTRLGLSVRATGDNPDMVRASSINPKTMITIGLCLANALTALAGCLLGEYQKSCDVNGGTGMVTIALASLIIGETLAGGKCGIPARIVLVIFGSCLYRIIVAIAMRLNMPASALKLISALIVAIAISLPYIKEQLRISRIKRTAAKQEMESASC